MGKSAERRKRVGILLTVGKNEAKKEELVSLRKRIPPRPWIKGAEKKFKVSRPVYNARPPTVGVPTDVSAGLFIKHNSEDFDVDFIDPKDISDERLAANDVNFMLIYDLLEAFHTDRSKNKKVFNNLKSVLGRATNVFPDLAYQEFVNSKLSYYNYFKSKNLPIAPTLTLSQSEWQQEVERIKNEEAKKGPSPAAPVQPFDVPPEPFDAEKAAAVSLLEKLHGEWDKFIAKPVYGQESKDCKNFDKNGRGNVEEQIERFVKYIKASIEKYPGIIFQKFVEGFGNTKESPELRMYFIGKEYQFTVVATRQRIFTLKSEGGKLRLPAEVDLEKLKDIAREVTKAMPPILLKSPEGETKQLPPLLTRVDMGCMVDGEFKPWVNEVEFVPSLYVEDHCHPIDGAIGKEMMNIVDIFLGMSKNDQQKKSENNEGSMDIDEEAGFPSPRPTKKPEPAHPLSVTKFRMRKRSFSDPPPVLQKFH